MSVKLAQIIKKDFSQSVAGGFTRPFASRLRERLFYDTSDSYTPSLGDSITFLQPVVSEISDDPKLRRSLLQVYIEYWKLDPTPMDLHFLELTEL